MSFKVIFKSSLLFQQCVISFTRVVLLMSFMMGWLISEFVGLTIFLIMVSLSLWALVGVEGERDIWMDEWAVLRVGLTLNI